MSIQKKSLSRDSSGGIDYACRVSILYTALRSGPRESPSAAGIDCLQTAMDYINAAAIKNDEVIVSATILSKHSVKALESPIWEGDQCLVCS